MNWSERADLAERMWPVAASFALQGDLTLAEPGELLAWVGGRRDDPELPLEWPGEAEPIPDGHTPQELRDAAADAMRLRRAGREVPPDLAARVLAYRVWRKQVQGVRKMPGPVPEAEAAEAADAAA